jgi:Tfp pilus assembly protein PilF
VTPEQREKSRQKVTKLIEMGKEFMDKNNLVEAERSFIEAISLDHQNQEAYKNLADVYVLQKNWEHAKESLEFLLKLDPQNVQHHLGLSHVCKQLDQMKEALEHAKTAVELSPNDPKNLNELLELSFMFGQKYTAKKTLDKLKEVNPENQRIPEWEEKLKQM